jgi:hypothetical protein
VDSDECAGKMILSFCPVQQVSYIKKVPAYAGLVRTKNELVIWG